MPKSTKQSGKKLPRRKLIVLLIVATLLLFVLIVDMFLTGYLKYSYNYIRCGKVPVSVTPTLFYTEDSGYSVPRASSYMITAQNIYYCTRDQAEADGKRPNPLSTEGQQRIEELKRAGKL